MPAINLYVDLLYFLDVALEKAISVIIRLGNWIYVQNTRQAGFSLIIT